ncbi:MAG: hypothetical protein AAGF12_40755 [Myxococcota bacterium]
MVRGVTVFGWVVLAGLLACSSREKSASDATVDRTLDGAVSDGDGGDLCACSTGRHNDRVFLLSDDGELWTFDPETRAFDFVVGPICSGMQPFSMAVDARGIAHVVFAESLAILTLDVNDPGPCEDSGYLRRNQDFGLFGMSFASESETDFCADLYVHTYDGEGPFEEGPGLGRLGVIDADDYSLRELAIIDFDGGELTGTGDGRLFAFAGANPVKLIEYDKSSGAVIEVVPLDGIQKTNASAAAFYGGDIYLFTEAVPAACNTCLMQGCQASLDACRGEPGCAEDLDCALAEGDIRDECGGLLPADLQACLGACDASCGVAPQFRTSQVVRFDLDAPNGNRTFETTVAEGPIRVVGAASSPCVLTGPF